MSRDEALKLVPTIGDTIRFRDLEPLLRLARNNPATLPSLNFDSLTTLGMNRPVGRPITVHGEVRVAPISNSADRRVPVAIDSLKLTIEQAEYVARSWVEAAQGEHASIASFARFVLQLLGLGAPPELLKAAIQAMADEVEHARDSFSVASSIVGSPVGPGELDISGLVDEPGDPRKILRDAIIEGCIAETMSAHEAKIAQDLSNEVQIKAILSRIAAEESNHADLAWRFGHWMLQKHPELIDELGVFSEEANTQTQSPADCAKTREGCLFGVLSQEYRRKVQRSTFEEIIAPKVDQLKRRLRDQKAGSREWLMSPVDAARVLANGLDTISV